MQWVSKVRVRTRARVSRWNFLRIGPALVAALAVLIALMPSSAWACACGCGVFEVATPSLLPDGPGGMVWIDYDFMDQYINWHATTPASEGQNNDKKLETNFVTAGGQYMLNRSWGAMIEVPYWQRDYTGAYHGNNADLISTSNNSIGDIRLLGMWTGLQEDMSTGFLAGFKVPSGDWHYPYWDRDTQIGTGSTDLLLGGYKIGNSPFTLGDRPFGWYVQGLYDLPFAFQDHYKPGRELDGAIGTFYDFGQVGPLMELAPQLAFLGSDRTRDRGTNASPNDSGYDRVQIAPGIETMFKNVRVYADVEVPLYKNMVGYQLTNAWATKLIISYSF
jgi:hypothetical protein